MIKIFETYNEIDPYEEENWNEKPIEIGWQEIVILRDFDLKFYKPIKNGRWKIADYVEFEIGDILWANVKDIDDGVATIEIRNDGGIGFLEIGAFEVKTGVNESLVNESFSLKKTLKNLLLTGLLTVSFMSNILSNQTYDKSEILKTYKEVIKETGEKEDMKIISFLQKSDTTFIPVIIFAIDTTAAPDDLYYFKKNPDGSYSKSLSNKYIIQMNGYVDDNNFYDANKKLLDNKYKIINYLMETEEKRIKEKDTLDVSTAINDYLYEHFKTRANTMSKLYELGLDDDDIFQIIVYMEGKLGIRVDDNKMIDILFNKNLTLKDLVEFIMKYKH
jgi:hypothetical protein